MIRTTICAATVLTAVALLAGSYDVSRVASGGTPAAPGPRVAMDAGGKTTKVESPVRLRTVKGKIVPPKELAGVKAVPESSAHLIMPVTLPEVKLPENMLRITPEQRLEWYNQWETREPGRRHALARAERRQIRSLDTPLSKDGTFTFRDVPPGRAFVEVEFYATNAQGLADSGKLLAVAAYELPAMEGSERSILDTGTLQPRKLETINARQRAPNIVYEMQTGSGQLADHQGKVVVLDFWGVWCGSCMAQLPELRAIHAKFQADPHFAMVSLSDGDQREEWEHTIRKEKMTWTQGILGTHEEAWQAKMYATVRYPTYWVIGADGLVVASGSQCTQMVPYIEEALKKVKSP